MFELFYSSGGHVGPYATREEAIEAALRLLRGRPQERSISVRRYVNAPELYQPEATVKRDRGIFRVTYEGAA